MESSNDKFEPDLFSNRFHLKSCGCDECVVFIGVDYGGGVTSFLERRSSPWKSFLDSYTKFAAKRGLSSKFHFELSPGNKCVDFDSVVPDTIIGSIRIESLKGPLIAKHNVADTTPEGFVLIKAHPPKSITRRVAPLDVSKHNRMHCVCIECANFRSIMPIKCYCQECLSNYTVSYYLKPSDCECGKCEDIADGIEDYRSHDPNKCNCDNCHHETHCDICSICPIPKNVGIRTWQHAEPKGDGVVDLKLCNCRKCYSWFDKADPGFIPYHDDVYCQCPTCVHEIGCECNSCENLPLGCKCYICSQTEKSYIFDSRLKIPKPFDAMHLFICKNQNISMVFSKWARLTMAERKEYFEMAKNSVNAYIEKVKALTLVYHDKDTCNCEKCKKVRLDIVKAESTDSSSVDTADLITHYFEVAAKISIIQTEIIANVIGSTDSQTTNIISRLRSGLMTEKEKELFLKLVNRIQSIQ